jgi:putative transposon-encoded protein
MGNPIQMRMEGFEVVEKIPERGGNSARIYVPKHWMGKKVRVVLIEQ